VLLKRAAGIVPEGIPLWRNSVWHLGAALDQAGNKQEALGYYIKSYNSGDPDPGRRAVIEQLYQKINGSLVGLDERIGASRVAANVSPEPSTDKPAAVETPSPSATPELQAAAPELTPTPAPVAVEAPPVATPEATPTPDASPSPAAESPTQSPASPPPTSPSPMAAEGLPEGAARLRPTVKIAGNVKDANGTAIANVVVVLISPRGTVLATTTDMEGNYSFIVSPSQQGYRVIPSKDGYTFQPVDKVVVSFTEDQKAVDFVAALSPAP